MKRLVAMLLAAYATGAIGQAFPTRPVTLIVPYAAGGSADVVARPVAAEMSKALGENVVVELRPAPAATSAPSTWRAAPAPTATPSSWPRSRSQPT